MKLAMLTIFYILIVFLDFLPSYRKRKKVEIFIYGIVFTATYVLLVFRSLDMKVPYIYPTIRSLFDN